MTAVIAVKLVNVDGSLGGQLELLISVHTQANVSRGEEISKKLRLLWLKRSGVIQPLQ